MIGKRVAAEPVAASSTTTTGKRKAEHEPAEEEYDDPFGAPAEVSPTPAVLQKSASLLSASSSSIRPLIFTNSSKSNTMSSMSIGAKKSSITVFTPSSKRSKSTPTTSSSSSFASPVSSSKLSPDALADTPNMSISPPGVTPSSTGVTSSISSSSSPPQHQQLHQSRIDLHYDETRASRAAKPAFKKQAEKLRTLNGTDLTCRLCNAWLDDVTVADHARVCQKLPGPISFPASCNCPSLRAGSTTAHDSTRCLLISQYLGSYDAHSWGGSQLLRITSSYQRSTSTSLTEKKRIRKVLKWIRSMLNSDEGRDLDSDDDEEDEDENSNTNGVNELDFTIQQGQELWIYTIRGGNKDQVACAALISLNVDLDRIQLNEQVVKVKSHPNQKQTSLMGFLQKSSSASSASPASSTAGAAATVPAATTAAAKMQSPIFGVDKIAVHSRFRFGASSSSSNTVLKVSLAHHMLNSIVASVQGRDVLLSSASATLPTHRVAFSTPTMAGARLAARFTNTQSFMTYAFKH